MNTDILIALGGVGLFLVGMTVMVEGLSQAVGAMIRRMLATWTRTPTLGAVFGALATAIVQSSSATTVMAVGFVGAGILSFPQALGILLGANIGTTITGWFVAIVGFKLQLGQAVMPLILVGMALRLFGSGRLRHAGWALVGFALLFVGIDAMKEGMAQYRGILTPASFPEDALFGRLQLVALGMAITIVTQSSSAGVAAALVALGTGTISLPQAAAIVIGMDIGTTFSAALATVGGSVATRRTGYAHVFYNALTGLFALILLGPYLVVVQPYLARDVAGNSQIALVAFHSLFNFLGVILFLPFAHGFARLMTRLVPERDPTVVRRLDERLLAEPASAVDAVAATLRDISRHAATCVSDLVSRRRPGSAVAARIDAIDQALEATHQFIDRIEPGGAHGKAPTSARTEATAGATAGATVGAFGRKVSALHTLDHLERVMHRCRQSDRIEGLEGDHRLERLSSILQAELGRITWDDLAPSEARFDRLRVLMRNQRRTYRQRYVERGIATDLSADEILGRLDSLRWLHRVSYHFWRITHHIRIANEHGGSVPARSEARFDIAED